LQAEFDERLWYLWGGAEPRPLTTREIVRHLESLGLSEEIICNRQILKLSSGQKCKLAFGAAFWTRPHILCLDEPTNYLDVEMIELLRHAIRNFRGCCVIVSHDKHFVEDVCDDIWQVKDGKVLVEGIGAELGAVTVASGSAMAKVADRANARTAKYSSKAARNK